MLGHEELALIPDVRLLNRGDLKKPKEKISPDIPVVLREASGWSNPVPGPYGSRKELALWLTDPNHPLTARVIVNRIWHWHFGRGIVATPNDFGKMGERPTHPELLDWLARQFVSGGWSIKNLHRTGHELRGPCPIHNGSANSKNFTVNIRKNAFKCFSKDCGARGNVLDFVAAIDHCDVRDAALKLKEWFKVGERQLQLPKQVENADKRAEIQRGLYQDKDGALYELLMAAVSAKDFEPLVVYRELFGDYQFWIAAAENFVPGASDFTLVKAL